MEGHPRLHSTKGHQQHLQHQLANRRTVRTTPKDRAARNRLKDSSPQKNLNALILHRQLLQQTQKNS